MQLNWHHLHPVCHIFFKKVPVRTEFEGHSETTDTKLTLANCRELHPLKWLFQLLLKRPIMDYVADLYMLSEPCLFGRFTELVGTSMPFMLYSLEPDPSLPIGPSP